jgi:hypothetical protein
MNGTRSCTAWVTVMVTELVVVLVMVLETAMAM